MNKIDERLAKLSEKLSEMSDKAAYASIEAKAVREEREEKIEAEREERAAKREDKVATVKGDVAAFQENVRLHEEEERSKLSSGLLKLQMTIEAKIKERRASKDQFMMQLYVADQLDYIDECFAIAAYLIENGQLAMYETMDAIKEYEAKYGKMGEGEQ